jgi:hypothetical protein
VPTRWRNVGVGRSTPFKAVGSRRPSGLDSELRARSAVQAHRRPEERNEAEPKPSGGGSGSARTKGRCGCLGYRKGWSAKDRSAMAGPKHNRFLGGPRTAGACSDDAARSRTGHSCSVQTEWWNSDAGQATRSASGAGMHRIATTTEGRPSQRRVPLAENVTRSGSGFPLSCRRITPRGAGRPRGCAGYVRGKSL